MCAQALSEVICKAEWDEQAYVLWPFERYYERWSGMHVLVCRGHVSVSGVDSSEACDTMETH